MRYIQRIVKISFLLLSISFNLNAQITFKTIIIESTPDNMKDAVISDFPPERNVNFGKSKQIIASRLNKNLINYLQRSLFKFDLSNLPPNCSIIAADLFLYAYDSLGYGNHTPTNGNATFDFAPIVTANKSIILLEIVREILIPSGKYIYLKHFMSISI